MYEDLFTDLAWIFSIQLFQQDSLPIDSMRNEQGGSREKENFSDLVFIWNGGLRPNRAFQHTGSLANSSVLSTASVTVPSSDFTSSGLTSDIDISERKYSSWPTPICSPYFDAERLFASGLYHSTFVFEHGIGKSVAYSLSPPHIHSHSSTFPDAARLIHLANFSSSIDLDRSFGQVIALDVGPMVNLASITRDIKIECRKPIEAHAPCFCINPKIVNCLERYRHDPRFDCPRKWSHCDRCQWPAKKRLENALY